MRIAIALAVVSLGAAQQRDAREIVRRSADANDLNWKVARNYTFLERLEQRRLDSGGRVKSREVKTYDLTLLEGSPYRRLVERDDHPLSAAEQRKEQEKLDRSITERSKETPSVRERRIAEYEKRRERERAMMGEVVDAYDFKIAGSDRIDGRDVWMIDATPRSGFQPHSRGARILPDLRGRLWIDKLSDQWVKLEAEVIRPVSFGLFLVRLEPAARISFDQTRVNDEVWLPRHIAVAASARIGLIKKLRMEEEITYKNFRKFQADARMVPQ